MNHLRITPSSSTLVDSLKAGTARVVTSTSGVTTDTALANADAALVQMMADIRALRLSLRGDAGTARQREREDRARRAS